MRIQVAIRLICVGLLFVASSSAVWGDDQDTAPPAPAAKVDKAEPPSKEQLHQQFKETLSGVKLVGRFTILGKDDGPLRKEEYTISSVSKLPNGDYWLFNTRIKYGANDLTVPLPLEVKWAGTTPLITLTDFTIPGMGTFSARVVIYRNKYAGTWSHGKVGGHLFGTIEKNDVEDESPDVKKTDAGKTDN